MEDLTLSTFSNTLNVFSNVKLQFQDKIQHPPLFTVQMVNCTNYIFARSVSLFWHELLIMKIIPSKLIDQHLFSRLNTENKGKLLFLTLFSVIYLLCSGDHEIPSYAKESTPYILGKDTNEVFSKLHDIQ